MAADPRRYFFLTPVLPYPTMGGADLRAWNIISALTTLGDVSVFALADRPGIRPEIDGLIRWECAPEFSHADVGTRHQQMWPRPGEDALPTPAT